jgi:multidrug efflux pump
VPGVNAFPILPASLGQSVRSRPVSFVVSTSESYDELARVAEAFLDEMRENPGFVSPDTDLKLTCPSSR